MISIDPIFYVNVYDLVNNDSAKKVMENFFAEKVKEIKNRIREIQKWERPVVTYDCTTKNVTWMDTLPESEDGYRPGTEIQVHGTEFHITIQFEGDLEEQHEVFVSRGPNQERWSQKEEFIEWKINKDIKHSINIIDKIPDKMKIKLREDLKKTRIPF